MCDQLVSVHPRILQFLKQNMFEDLWRSSGHHHRSSLAIGTPDTTIFDIDPLITSLSTVVGWNVARRSRLSWIISADVGSVLPR